MLGISFGEILIIATIGLLVIGPKRLPETARFIGHLIGRVQRQVNSVKSDIRREMAMEDMKSIKEEYQEVGQNMRNVFDQAASGMSPAETLLNQESSKENTDTAITPPESPAATVDASSAPPPPDTPERQNP
ncbi:MAG: Sec-independent protein translocase protein TatB [Proteobacteria bacterium]|nr:Sec-independent protein translocase protein TatB [Pseudomonadota bacterium]